MRTARDGEPGWTSSGRLWLLGLGLFLIYSANGRGIGGGDIVPATLLPVALLRGDGPVLDRFDHVLRNAEGRLPGYATESRGHVVSRYPLGAAILAAPCYLPRLLILDVTQPGWERDAGRARRECTRMGKDAAAMLAALAAVALGFVLRRLGLERVAWPTVLAAALGSDLWAVGSQGLWQHGPAALCLTLALLLLLDPSPSRRVLALAGVATAGMVVCRPIDLVFAGVIAVWVRGGFRVASDWRFSCRPSGSPWAFASITCGSSTP